MLIYNVLQKFTSQKEQLLPTLTSSFEQFGVTFGGLHAVIDIESWWVYSHIKLRWDLEQNATNDESQFDMAVNPL